MIIKTSDTPRSSTSDRQYSVASWRLTVLAIGVVASIASGIGAYAFLSATHPVANRVSWSLEPAHKTRITRLAASGNLQAANVTHRFVRAM